MTISVDDLTARLEAATERGADRAAAKYERVLARYASILEGATAAAGLKAWLTVKDAALYVGRTEDTVRRWIQDGMPAERGPRGYLIERAALDRYRTGSAPDAAPA